MAKPLIIIRKVFVLILGIPVLILGLILIPLPGPGVLVSLLALIILSFEFEVAKKYRDKILTTLRQGFAAAKAKNAQLRKDQTRDD